MNSNDHNYELLARYLSGECSEEEIRYVREMMKKDNEIAELAQRLTVFRDTRKSVIQRILAKQSWSKLEKKIEMVESAGEPSFTGKSSHHLSNRRLLNRSILRQGNSLWLIKAAAVFLVAGLTALFTFMYIDANRDESLVDRQEIVTNKGQRSNIHLNDGSRILVNSSSRISYLPFSISDESRVIELSGEAYFDVAGEVRPFMVYVDDVIVKVLGTSFAIRSYEEENSIQVAVSSGKVSVGYLEKREGDEFFLEEGDMITISRDHSLSPVVERNMDMDRVLGWIDYRFEFDNVTLGHVAGELERIYGVAIELQDPEMHQRRITTRFEGESLHKVLGVITIALNLQYEINGDKVMLFERSDD